MKIAHFSDIHIRNLKFHQDYRRVFDNLYGELRDFAPDIIVNTGDTAHTKTQISPEFVQMAAEHFLAVSEIAPYHVILGNHDLNLMNSDRQDAITPIVNSLRPERNAVFLHKKSGLVQVATSPLALNFWVFGIADPTKYPQPSEWAPYSSSVNVGLFHGSVANCLTDSNWRMTHAEADIGMFDGLDYVLMGDIHKQQFMDREQRRVAYAGSLIQQNFGEDHDKGFLAWDIRSKDEHEVRPIYLHGSRKFYTVRLADDLSVLSADIDPGSRLRISPPRPLTLVEQKEVERNVRRLYRPHDVITLSSAAQHPGKPTAPVRSLSENLRQLGVQERLLREWMARREVPERVSSLALELNRRYQAGFEQDDETARNVSWRLNSIAWSNMFNYGESNHVDFESIGGLTGLFAENSRGKSSFIDVITEACFDKVTKGITRNVDMVNDNKSLATMVAEVTVDGKRYTIERAIERLKQGARRGGKDREFGKTSCNFYAQGTDGLAESLNSELRPGTERAIRRHLGNFEDFMLTGLTSQVNTLDLISCKETDRKKILYKFLDLDIFEQKGALARDDAKVWYQRLRELEESGAAEEAARLRSEIAVVDAQIEEAEAVASFARARARELGEEVVAFAAEKVRVDPSAPLIEPLRDELARASRRLAKAEENERSQEALSQTLMEELATIGPEPANRHDELVSARVRLGALEVDIETKKGAVDRASEALKIQRKKLPLLDEVPCGEQYPSCKFLIDAFSAKSKVPGWDEKLARARAELRSLEQTRTELLPEIKGMEAEEGMLTRLREARHSLDMAVKEGENVALVRAAASSEVFRIGAELARAVQWEDDVKKNVALDARISELLREKSNCEDDSERGRRLVNSLVHSRGAKHGLLARLEEQVIELQAVRDRVTAYEHYSQAMGKDGIAYEILTEKLPLINDEINKILSSAADFGVVIEHDPEEQSVRLYLQYGDYRPRILELAGGAEKMLASIAIRTALLSISSLPKPNFFVIDEGFGKLDPRNMENVGRMFDYLKTVFEHVIVISHVESMRDMVDNMLEITSDEEGYSHIEV